MAEKAIKLSNVFMDDAGDDGATWADAVVSITGGNGKKDFFGRSIEATIIVEAVNKEHPLVSFFLDELIAICELAQEELRQKGFALVRLDDEQEKEE